ncbi:MAG: O-acetyl-ADP-ribose deacetylase [Pirellulales bacterium]
MQLKIGDSLIELTQGDITRQQVDAIVNAANSQLAGGGGVDGAIHADGGPEIMAETEKLYPQGCPTGKAVASTAGLLPARFVFHAVGPIWRGGHKSERALLSSAHVECLNLAVEHDCRSIAFPALSTGAYGFPIDLAAEAALEAVREFLEREQRPALVRFVLFSEGAFGAFARVLESYAG